MAEVFSEESEDAISTMGTRGSGVSYRELFNGDDSYCGQTTLQDIANQVAAMDGHEPAKLLFTLSAVNGTIVETGPDIHELTVQVPDLVNLIAFTDLPSLYAFTVGIPKTMAMWSEGRNSFAADTPRMPCS